MSERRIRYLLEKRLSGALSASEQDELHDLLNDPDQHGPGYELEPWQPITTVTPARRPVAYTLLLTLAGLLTVGVLVFNVWLFFYMYERANSFHESVVKHPQTDTTDRH